jgi:hypothetical protein
MATHGIAHDECDVGLPQQRLIIVCVADGNNRDGVQRIDIRRVGTCGVSLVRASDHARPPSAVDDRAAERAEFIEGSARALIRAVDIHEQYTRAARERAPGVSNAVAASAGEHVNAEFVHRP